jgi:glucose uptake protein
VAGVVFNLANMLLIAAISLAGMSVAFPIGIGLALIIGVTLNYFIQPAGNPVLLFGGIALVTLAILFDSRAYALKDKESRQLALAAEAKAQAEAAAKAAMDPQPTVAAKQVSSRSRSKKQAPVARKGVGRGIMISLLSGLLMGCFYPILSKSMVGDLGLGAYAAALLFAIGVFVSTLFFNIFFLNIPLVGERIPITNYFKGTAKQHLLGIVGGVIWAIGAISNFAAATAPASVNVGPAISLAIGQCATLISVLWGLFIWKEFAGASSKVWRLIIIMLLLFVGGLTALCLAPLIKF